MKKIFLTLTVIFIVLMTSCMSQKYTEETFEIKKSKDLSEDIEKYGTPDKILESTEKWYYVKTCTWNDIDGKEISCDYSSIEMRTCKRETPLYKTPIQVVNPTPIQQVKKATTQIKKTDYETDIKRFGYPDDISTYRSDGYYSKTCTWYDANGKYRSYDYNEFGKRTSTFESNPIR